MPKSTKRFVITDDSLNRHGYRVLTVGVDATHFVGKNPIMLWMHGRAWGRKDEVLPLGHWQDIEVSDTQITAIPYFSDDDDFALSIYKKVEEGTIRMASAGFDPLETSEDAKYMVPGQKYPTVTKSTLLEASLVDMGSNDNACALYKNGALIQLSSEGAIDKTFFQLLKNKNSNMNPQLMAIAIMLNLGKDATEIQLAEKMTSIHAEYLQLSTENEKLTKELAGIKTAYEKMQKEVAEKEVNDMLTLAVKEGKITEAQKPEFKDLAVVNLASVKNLLDKMPKHITIERRLGADTAGTEDPILKLSYDELHKSGKLAHVKEQYPEHYKTIYKAQFGKEPKN